MKYFFGSEIVENFDENKNYDNVEKMIDDVVVEVIKASLKKEINK